MLGAKMVLHVFLPLVIVEGSEMLYWRRHFECKENDWAAVANAVRRKIFL